MAAAVNAPPDVADPLAKPAAGDPELLDQLERLAALRASGALDDVEFTAAKRRLLGL
ncbi:SHOCT domain-containing protein [Streptacidiphilus carbonis]|jgi:hypothetical protein|uniref:SHOCT domain-containing protein n=1 Tax=Streptacidiphilus carbonis TaxID=105422 RepID=UPI0009FEC146|nr:SHOCT domain-containing protein [Streptacidiphilus carbonis]